MPLTDLTYQVMCSHSINKVEKELVIIIPITEKEEEHLDKGSLRTVKSGITFNIESSDIICYGQIDFSNKSDDYAILEEMRWLDYLGAKGLCIPSDYNYNEHCCYSPISRCRYTETFNPAKVSQYFHARLNKPQRCCIFKERRYGK